MLAQVRRESGVKPIAGHIARTAAILALSGVAAACQPQTLNEGGQPPMSFSAHELWRTECDRERTNAECHAVDVRVDDTRVYVLGSFPPFLRVFSSTGDIIQTLGSHGEGPGELGIPIATYPYGDELIIHDGLPHRLVIFDREGRYQRKLDLPALVFLNSAFDPSTGTLAILMFQFGEEAARLRRYDLESGESDETVLTLPGSFAAREFEGISRRERLTLAMATCHRCGGRILLGDTWEYRILRYGVDGTFEPFVAETRPRPQGLINGNGDEPEQARNLPHFDRFALDSDGQGRTWVRTYREHVDKTSFDIFGPDGSFLGSVEIPAAMQRSQRGYDAWGSTLVTIHGDPSEETHIRLWSISETSNLGDKNPD